MTRLRFICGCGAQNYHLSDWWVHKTYRGWGRFFRHILFTRIEWRTPRTRHSTAFNVWASGFCAATALFDVLQGYYAVAVFNLGLAVFNGAYAYYQRAK